MNGRIRQVLALGSLVGAAATCAVLAYAELTPRGTDADGWTRAIALTRQAERTDAVLPALRLREEAVARFDELARSGSRSSRSHARLLAGLLEVKNAAAQPDRRQALALAVTELQGALRLDRANEDAAYDLELLLTRSVQNGRPIGKPTSEKNRSVGRSGTAAPGTGY